MTRSHQNQIEITRIITPGGISAWAVTFRDIYSGPRPLERHWTKPDAIRAAERLSRTMRTPFVRGERHGQRVLAARIKFAAWEKRQKLVAQRAARRAN